MERKALDRHGMNETLPASKTALHFNIYIIRYIVIVFKP